MPIVYCNDCGEAIEVVAPLAARGWALCKRCGCEVNVSCASKSNLARQSQPARGTHLRSPRMPARPRIHATVYPRFDSTVEPDVKHPQRRLAAIAQWVTPVYWLKFEPVGIKDAAQVEVRAWQSRHVLRQRFRLGRFSNPEESYPTTMALAMSLQARRVVSLAVEEPDVQGPTRRIERREAALRRMWTEEALALQFAADDPILAVQFHDLGKHCGRMLQVTLLGVQTIRLEEQPQHWRATTFHLSWPRSIAPNTESTVAFGRTGVAHQWWDPGPKVHAPPRRKNW